jgi:hypothetical protein
MLNFADRMQDGCMVAAAEPPADFREGMLRQFAAEVHCDLPREHDVPRPLLGNQIVEFDVER